MTSRNPLRSCAILALGFVLNLSFTAQAQDGEGFFGLGAPFERVLAACDSAITVGVQYDCGSSELLLAIAEELHSRKDICRSVVYRFKAFTVADSCQAMMDGLVSTWQRESMNRDLSSRGYYGNTVHALSAQERVAVHWPRKEMPLGAERDTMLGISLDLDNRVDPYSRAVTHEAAITKNFRALAHELNGQYLAAYFQRRKAFAILDSLIRNSRTNHDRSMDWGDIVIDHVHTAFAIALLEVKLGKPSQAIDRIRAISVQGQLEGRWAMYSDRIHPTTLIGLCHEKTGNVDSAALYLMAAGDREAVQYNIRDHTLVGWHLSRVADKQGDHASADVFRSAIVQSWTNGCPSSSDDYRAVLRDSVELLLGRFLLADAIRVQRKLVANTHLWLTKNDHRTGVALQQLAELSLRAGDTTAAVKASVEASQVLRSAIVAERRWLNEEGSFELNQLYAILFDKQAAFNLALAKQHPELAGQQMGNILVLSSAALNARTYLEEVLSAMDTMPSYCKDEWLRTRYDLLRDVNKCRTSSSSSGAGLQTGPRLSIRELDGVAHDLEVAILDRTKSWQKRLASMGISVKSMSYQTITDANEAIVLFYEYQAGSDSEGKFDGRYLACIRSGKDKTTHLVDLGPSRELRNLMKDLDDERLAQEGDTSRSGSNIIKVLRLLYEAYWSPIEVYLNGAAQVFLSASGPIDRLPFHAMVDQQGVFLGTYMGIRHVLSFSQWSHNGARVRDRSVTIFAPVNFGELQADTPAPLDPGGNPIPTFRLKGAAWPELRWTSDEAILLKALCKRSGVMATVRSGTDASEEHFKQVALKTPTGVLHLATHGFFRGPNSRPFFPGEVRFGLSPAVLDRTGILFSGANRKWLYGISDKNAEDGVLTATEMATLDLGSLDLVVLSACETALGIENGPEGVMSLPRALRLAGVKQVVASIWPVDDERTVDFMLYFYDKLFKEGVTIPIAFHSAQEHAREGARDGNIDWAGFRLIE